METNDQTKIAAQIDNDTYKKSNNPSRIATKNTLRN